MPTSFIQPPDAQPAVTPVANLQSYFHRALSAAAENQHTPLDDQTLAYLVHLLSDYAHADRLYDRTEDGVVRRPLVALYRQAVEAETSHERELALQRLGDLALFVSGILPQSLQRSLVDVDYYVAMGAAAYASLSDASSPGVRVRSLRAVFTRLASRFVDHMDLLAETVERSQAHRCTDLLRLHELWSKTGSRRLQRQLSELGVMPLRPAAVN